MPLIKLDHVHKIYPNGFHALHGIDLQIQAGEFVTVIGRSGAGKTTLIRLFNGLEAATQGRVIIDNQALERRTLRKIRSQVGMVFQHFNLVDQLNVMSNVLCGRLATRHWLPSLFYLFSKQDFHAASHALERVGLTDKAWNRADKLSGGQQQRVGLARALAMQPKIILADEPIASLDPVIGEEIMQLLKDICRQDGITVVANLHQPEFVKKFSDRILGLVDGQVVFDGKPAQLTEDILATIYQKNGYLESRGDIHASNVA